MSNKKRIGVIFGGRSPEHEVSRVSAQNVINNIDRDKYEVLMIGITKDCRWLIYEGPVKEVGTGGWQAIAEANEKNNKINVFELFSGDKSSESLKNICKRLDIVFPVLHGCNGEDGTIQGMFELFGIPYVGCGVLSSALAMDKAYSKLIFEKYSIPIGKYLVFDRSEINEDNIHGIIEKVEAVHTYPCFVKPSNTGSSIGVSKARDRNQLVDAIYLASRYDSKILIEEYIEGGEYECAVLGNKKPEASVVGEIIPCNEFYDYEAKYSPDSTSKIVIPAELPEDISNEIRKYAIEAFKALECSGLARVDFFVQKGTNRVYINEVNTLPGFTNISMYPKLWEATGIKYSELIDRLINLALERFQDRKREFDI